ncbi:MAG: non-canonical purine NTP pyrophosphatase [Patescibacteria group bacterium]|nr:non-canonical purine NTP pyrophosphatase [Patescibacteria group bacterium]MDW8279954.1 non-canonical purine NTP pyrophosphatase [bacterium]
MIYFITGNKNKYEEIKDILYPIKIKHLDIDLPEIQDINPENIIKFKLKEAFKYKKAQFIVEDTSLYLDCLNDLPGPMIKWFLKTIGDEGVFKIANLFGNTKAVAKTIIGYAEDIDKIKFFEGKIYGKIVFPKGENGFGWDRIFMPEGFNKTFAEIEFEEKNKFSMRKIAAENFKNYLISLNINLNY